MYIYIRVYVYQRIVKIFLTIWNEYDYITSVHSLYMQF